ncbi:MAG: tail fiber domain-containing protein [Bacteroidetes bacterium]|nr:tail fiber domain-containing protein [Bacteroidota bacterium]
MKTKLAFSLLLALTITCKVFSQGIGINSSGAAANSSSGLDVDFSNKGVLIPRVSLTGTSDVTTISSAATSLIVYNTASVSDVTPGFYFWSGSAWVRFVTTSSWSLTGNSGTTDGTHFIGTTDDKPLNFKVNNQKAGRIENTTKNTFFGYTAGNAITSGAYNTAMGYEALKSNTSGNNHVAIGYQALYSNDGGGSNLAIGFQSLYRNTSGYSNISIGYRSLYTNISGVNNTAVGHSSQFYNTSSNNTSLGHNSLLYNSTGYHNSAVGSFSLYYNTDGFYNVAIGSYSLYDNISGDENTAVGNYSQYRTSTSSKNTSLGTNSLYTNTTGSENTALGYNSLYYSTTSSDNTAVGVYSLYNNTTGAENTALGIYSQYSTTTSSKNTSLGANSLYNNTTGYNNTAVGYAAGNFTSSSNNCTFIGCNSTVSTTRSNVTMLGASIANAQCTNDDQVLLGNTAITSIRAQVSSITAYSDARFKFNIKPDVKGLDFIMKLKPVTYNQNPEILHQIWGTPDSILKHIKHDEIKKMKFIGFLAQDVKKAADESGFDFPGIDVPRNDKEVYSLRYTDFIMPMVKAIQELKAENDLLKDEIVKLKATVGKVTSDK